MLRDHARQADGLTPLIVATRTSAYSRLRFSAHVCSLNKRLIIPLITVLVSFTYPSTFICIAVLDYARLIHTPFTA